MENSELWNFISDVARVVLAGVIVAVGVGMINVGNSTRKTEQKVEDLEDDVSKVDELHKLLGKVVAQITEIKTELRVRVEGADQAIKANTDDHLRLEDKIETTFQAGRTMIAVLKQDLVREFRKNGGGTH